MKFSLYLLLKVLAACQTTFLSSHYCDNQSVLTSWIYSSNPTCPGKIIIKNKSSLIIPFVLWPSSASCMDTCWVYNESRAMFSRMLKPFLLLHHCLWSVLFSRPSSCVYWLHSAALCWSVRALRTEWGSCLSPPRSCSLVEVRTYYCLGRAVHMVFLAMQIKIILASHVLPDKAMDRRNSSFKIWSTSLTPSSPCNINGKKNISKNWPRTLKLSHPRLYSHQPFVK